MEKMKIMRELRTEVFKLSSGKLKMEGPLCGTFVHFDDGNFYDIGLADNGKSILIVEDDHYLHINGLLLAAVARFNLIGNDNWVYVICIDRFLSNMPDYVKAAMISHEIGHINSGHIDNYSTNQAKKDAIRRTLFNVPIMEYEADDYASRKIGTDILIKGYEWVRRNTDISYVAKTEFKKRIERLKMVNGYEKRNSKYY